MSTAVVGIVCTASDADATAFPLDTPVLLTNVVAALGKAGTKGTLRRTLDAIGRQTKPVTIVVRVAEGKDAAETATNVIGTVTADGKYTGMKALLGAQARFGVKPRILATPGLDTQPSPRRSRRSRSRCARSPTCRPTAARRRKKPSRIASSSASAN